MQAPLQKYASVVREKAAQRCALQSSDQVQLDRKASLIDGASDSEDEEQPALRQSEREDEAHEAEEVCAVAYMRCYKTYKHSHCEDDAPTV